MPGAPADRAWVRSIALGIACDIHPINNLRVLKYLAGELKVEEPARDEWYRHCVQVGFAALEAQLAARATGPYAFGASPTLADICIVPQVANAQRLKVPMEPYPRIAAINAAGRWRTPTSTARDPRSSPTRNKAGTFRGSPGNRE